ncbi:polysaccharide pyruvyl transferase family protein [Elizabethkingia sp. JS20170427COW]|uniref:polysaccharide pyruvyl transferase family protein n=1 Tax=Elizabethkingia sp. JS20170427COW TaxID=2583851 RepID=UPI0011102A66|nr:polysaccharide pyruvyl transferase family protein [Elizabethkingia sp. JS20170427COW]QCX53673.1 polysaccharide pyruvyl transferase family protein [Elizabethkingia sp. JS20170427COW]
MIKSDILFTGYYGQLNTGDDAFVEVAAWGAQKFWNKQELRFLAVKQRLPNIKTDIKGYPIRIPKSYELQQELLLKNTSYLVSAGGSTFQNYIENKSIKAKAKHLADEKKLKIGAIGVSIGPFKSIKEELSNIEYLKRMSFLAVRDQRSFDYVQTLDLPYEPVNAFDLAALLPEIYGIPNKSQKNKRKTIGISVCNYESYIKGDISNEKKRNQTIVALLKELDKQLEVDFKFFIINGHKSKGDLMLTKEIIGGIEFKNNVEIRNYNPNTREVWNQIGLCDFVITTRLHAGIFACFSDTPFMMIEYHKKCTDFLNDVEQPINYRLNDADFNQSAIVQVVSDIMDEKEILLPNAKREMIDKAFLNFKNINL